VTGIHQLLVMLPPRAHIALLRDELGGLAVVGFQKVDGFLPFGEPEFGLSHNVLQLEVFNKTFRTSPRGLKRYS